MSRHAKGDSYGHAIKQFALDHFRLYWTIDFYYASSRQRHPREFSRDTDEAGARRFAKRWQVNMPQTTKAPAPAEAETGAKAGA